MSTNSSPPPPITHILETCLYVRDVDASAAFYKSALNIEPFMKSRRTAAFNLGATTLLLFQLGLAAEDVTVNSGKAHGIIPGHGPTPEKPDYRLKQHFCLAVQTPLEVQQWDAHLQKGGVRILGHMDWERGGKSVYFEDLDGHVGEIGSRGIWPHY